MNLDLLLFGFFQGVSPIQLGELFGSEGAVDFFLDIAASGFSLVLFLVTLFAWSRRGRQLTLLIVSFAFLTFFISHVLGALPYAFFQGELFHSVMDFLTLALFFVALVVRPQRNTKVAERESSGIGYRN